MRALFAPHSPIKVHPMSEEIKAKRRTLRDRITDVRPADLVILFFLCVLVGLILAFFNVDPRDLWIDFFATVAEAWTRFFSGLGDLLGNALSYFFLGAVVILPIWLVWHLVRALLRR
ncbi:MAG: DUF6460 domain-containing protein [Oceanicaulis sp.]